MLRRLLLVIMLLGFVPQIAAQNTDIDLLRRINGPINTRPDVFMRGISNSVMPLMIAVPAGLLIYHRTQTGSWTEKREPYVIGAVLVVNLGITYGLKKAVNRPRPFVQYPSPDIYQKDSHVGTYSFPSGHSSSAFALATSVCLAYPKWYVIAPAAVWAFTVGYSRMHLGVHFPSDVLMGAIIGSGCAVLGHYLNRQLVSGQ
jgi:membrane-associated phospholipid phosphatase